MSQQRRNHRIHHHVLLAAVACFAMAGCGREAQEPQPVPRSIEAIADEYLAALLERRPEMATTYAVPGARHDGIFDNSLEALAAWQAREDAWLTELNSIGKPGDIGSRDWATYGILYGELTNAINTRVCRNELWQASRVTGWHNYLPSIFDLQPLDTAEQREQALSRLGKVAGYIDTEITNLRRGLALGYSAPRVTVEAVPAEMRALIGEGSPFVALISRAGDVEFESRGRQIIDAEVAPAIERFAAFIEDEYLSRAREEIALSANPDGAACYPALVQSYATIAMPAGRIHQTGLDELESILAEVQQIIDEHYGGGDPGEFFKRIISDPEFTFETEDDVLQHSLDALDAVRGSMSDYFNLLPKADVIIEPYPPYRGGATGEYQSSSEDGSRPGIFLIPVTDPTRRSRAVQQTLLHHETYPGHHLQGAIALELGDRAHPLVRYTWNAGFGEGWGLYSERLADEMGLYAGDPLGRLGMLSDQSARAARLIIDTGLHTKGWSRQQALDHLRANSAWSDVDVAYEIDRYISMPGQANAYMLGKLEISRLRTLAAETLGETYDIRQFHDRVLENGSMTLPMLDEVISEWLSR
jgi:uncharacterized protein (DUF885 family)